MTFKGYAFRGTLAGGSGFPGDAANDTFADPTVNYAYPENGGVGFGWAFGPGGNVSNRNSPVNAHYGGQFSNNSGSEWFRIDVPNGQVDVKLLVGSGNNAVRLRHGAGAVANTDYHDVTGVSGTTYPQATDATGAIFTDANAWDAGQTPLRVTVTAGYLRVEKQPSISFNTVAYVAFQPVTTVFVDCTFSDEIGVAGAPTLYESQPANKLVAQITQSVGGKPYSSLGVFENDGVTPSLYLEIIYINGQPWLRHKAVRMPNLSGMYNFKLIQTDISGAGYYTNSPYVQSLAWGVTAAPTKPYNDSSFLSKISTPAFLLRKKVVDIFQQAWNPTTKVGEWPGYTGGAFDFTATVFNYTQLKAQLKTYQNAAKSASNKKYCILIDTDGTSDWTTHSMTIVANQWTSGDQGLDMYPQNGNLLYITYAAGPKLGPVMYGGWNFYISYIRGLHVDGLIWGGDASATTEVNGDTHFPYGAITWGYKSTSPTTMGILKVTNCDIGLMFNPTYTAGGGITPKTIDTSRYLSGFATGSNGDDMEQFICSNCRFWGVNISFTLTGTRMVHISNVDVAYCNNDTLAMQCLRTEASVNFPDMNQYEWLDDINLRYIYNYDSGIHADFLQQRALGNGNHDASNMVYRLFENGSCYLNWDDINMQRNCQIVSDAANISSCYINNIFSHNATRGIDTSGGTGASYCEYNSLPPNHTSAAGATLQPQTIESSWGAKVYSRKNILGSPPGGGEDNVGFSSSNTSGVSPNTVMVGPFAADVNNTTYWAAPEIPDAVPTYDLATYKAAMQAAFVGTSGVTAGFQPATTIGRNQAALNITTLFH